MSEFRNVSQSHCLLPKNILQAGNPPQPIEFFESNATYTEHVEILDEHKLSGTPYKGYEPPR